MRVFVTGATGFVGAHTAEELLRAGHEVVALARNPDALEEVFARRGVGMPEVVKGCMTDAAAVERGLEGCDGVVHAAAVVGLDAGTGDRTWAMNMAGVENVVGGAVRHGIERIVYVSSAVVLFQPGGREMDETSPLASSCDPYGRSKVDGELHVRDLQEQGAPVQITYPVTVIGPDDPHLSSGNLAVQVFARWIRLVTTTGLQFIDARDLARAHRLLLERGCPGSPVSARYLAPGHYAEWPALADLFREATGQRRLRLRLPAAFLRVVGRLGDVVLRFVPLRLPITREAMSYITAWSPARSDRLEVELGVEARPLLESLRDTVEWMREAGWLRRPR